MGWEEGKHCWWLNSYGLAMSVVKRGWPHQDFALLAYDQLGKLIEKNFPTSEQALRAGEEAMVARLWAQPGAFG